MSGRNKWKARIYGASFLLALICHSGASYALDFVVIDKNAPNEICDLISTSFEGRDRSQYFSREHDGKDLNNLGVTFYSSIFVSLPRREHVNNFGKIKYYKIDIDNDGRNDYFRFMRGGFGPGGEGDQLIFLSGNPEDEKFEGSPLLRSGVVLGSAKNYISYGGFKSLGVYFISPIRVDSTGRNYLIIKSEAADDVIVLEVVAGEGLKGVCVIPRAE